VPGSKSGATARTVCGLAERSRDATARARPSRVAGYNAGEVKRDGETRSPLRCRRKKMYNDKFKLGSQRDGGPRLNRAASRARRAAPARAAGNPVPATARGA
jgi:hypothetical protein